MHIALVQMTLETGRRSANLVRALGWIDKACDLDPCPDLVVLPACCDIGWLPRDAMNLAGPVGGPFVESLAAKAREMGIHLVAGLNETDAGSLYVAAVLFDPDGDVLLRQRMIDPAASSCSSAGEAYASGCRLEVRRIPWGCMGLGVATERSEDCLTTALAAMGADLVVAPAAWACDRDRQDAAVSAIRKRVTALMAPRPIALVLANAVGDIDDGAWTGKAFCGGSMAYGPDGRELLVGSGVEQGLLSVEIELGDGASSRRRT